MPAECIIACLAERVGIHHSPFHCITGRHTSALFLCALVNGRRVICLTVHTSLKMGYLSLCVSPQLKALRRLVLAV